MKIKTITLLQMKIFLLKVLLLLLHLLLLLRAFIEVRNSEKVQFWTYALKWHYFGVIFPCKVNAETMAWLSVLELVKKLLRFKRKGFGSSERP